MNYNLKRETEINKLEIKKNNKLLDSDKNKILSELKKIDKKDFINLTTKVVVNKISFIDKIKIIIHKFFNKF